VLLAWLFISMRLLSKNLLSRCGLGNGLVLEKVMLLEYEGGSVAGKVMPGPVVCLLRRGGFVVEVGDVVTVDVVNLPDFEIDVVALAVELALAAATAVAAVAAVAVVAVVAVAVAVAVAAVTAVAVIVAVAIAVAIAVAVAVAVVVAVVAVAVAVAVVVAVAVAVAVDNDVDNDGEGGLASETLDVAGDFSSILSELEFSEDDGLDAFDVMDETLSAFSLCVFDASLLPYSIFGPSVFFPEKSRYRQSAIPSGARRNFFIAPFARAVGLKVSRRNLARARARATRFSGKFVTMERESRASARVK